MKKIFQQNAIRIAIGVVFILILTGVTLSFYNRYVMSDALTVQHQNEAVLKEIDRIHDNIRFMDISARGYALIRKEQFLFWTPASARYLNAEIFAQLDSLFEVQGFVDPKYGKMKEAMTHYTATFTKMVDHLQHNELNDYLAMLEFDYGKIFYETFTPFLENITAFEAELASRAQEEYAAATEQNRIIQLILSIFGLPTLIWILNRLAKDERERKKLLLDLEKNNRQYLFDNGEAIENDVRTILQTSIKNLQKASAFVTEISTGNYKVQWDGMHENNSTLNSGNLAGRLIFMRDEMKRLKEEDARRMWTTQGLSELSDIIRKHQSNLEELTFLALTFIVKYSRSQQGCLFVAKEDENHHKHLELSACYAFDRKKHVEKKLNIGQGLIGQAFLDASTTLLKQIPDSYLHITSGLGHAMPRCVVIVPMKNNEKVEAIAELATFEEYLPHEVAFFEKCGEFIASAIATAQQAQRNQAMMERMQSQTEQLRNQEEELRQNIEELEATQEAMRRQAQETKTDTKVIL